MNVQEHPAIRTHYIPSAKDLLRRQLGLGIYDPLNSRARPLKNYPSSLDAVPAVKK